MEHFALVAYILLLSGLVTSAIPGFDTPPSRNRHYTAYFMFFLIPFREWTDFCKLLF